MRWARGRLALLVLGGASGACAPAPSYVPLPEPSTLAWILVYGEGLRARLVAADADEGPLLVSEETRVRALGYPPESALDPVPVASTEGGPYPAPLGLFELRRAGEGFDWGPADLTTFELRRPGAGTCARLELEATVELPLEDAADLHKSSLVLSDGRLVVGGVTDLFLVDRGSAVRLPWASTSTARAAGPRSLSESSEGLWFEAAGELHFTPLNGPGAPIEPGRFALPAASRPVDFVHAQPSQPTLYLIDVDGRVLRGDEAGGVEPLLEWEPDGELVALAGSELLLARRGDEARGTWARYARWRAGALEEERPFGEELTRGTQIARFEGLLLLGAEAGRVAVHLGEGWERRDHPDRALQRITAFAPTESGFLAGDSGGLLSEHRWATGYCAPGPLLGGRIERIHPLGDGLYAVLTERLAAGVRLLRYHPPSP